MDQTSPNLVSRGHWGVIAMAVVLLLVVGVYGFQKVGQRTIEIAQGQQLVSAPAGQVIGGFPQELILDKSAVVADSYSISYVQDGVTQPYVKYVSSKTLAENVTMFAQFLKDNGWTVSRAGSANERPATFFYAKKGKADVSVNLRETPESKTEVGVAYVVNP